MGVVVNGFRFNAFRLPAIWLFGLLLASCGGSEQHPNPEKNNEQPVVNEKKIQVPVFNEDSAYAFIAWQVAAGPRVPGTAAHAKTAEFIEKTCAGYGLKIYTQHAPVHTYDMKTFKLRNIIAAYNPEAKERILLLTHWDTRPIADADSTDSHKPIIGADDGGSGTGVLLEIVRIVSSYKPDVGIDFFFTDLEDYGQPDNSKHPRMENSWCLGTQYWASSPHIQGYRASYGILLDMVGAKNARFPREGVGNHYAPDVMEKVWTIAKQSGYAEYFIDDLSGNITDDHLYVNMVAHIPCIDIVSMDPQTSRFGQHHHTHKDNMDIIDRKTLKAVGQTVLETLWRE